MSRLILYTTGFPYGNGEAFIENELPVLCDSFDEVIVFPLRAVGAITRSVPRNCTVLQPVVSNNRQAVVKGLLRKAPLWYFVKKFFTEKAWCHPFRAKKYLATVLMCRSILSDPDFRTVNRNDATDVHYFYWGIGFAHILPFINRASNKVVRFHRTDLYLETRRQQYIPFRREVFSYLSTAVFISRQGMDYARKTYSDIPFRAVVSYLGTQDRGISVVRKDPDTVRIVSCAFVVPVKRLGRIVEALKLITPQKVHWTHIGDGPQMASLQESAKQLPDNITVDWKGAVANEQVYDIYRSQPFDVFVNVSSSEGLPVSIMEAVSFGIPVVATDVGGTAEIVTSESGVLLPPAFDAQELASALLAVRENRENYHPRKVWEENFRAVDNYRRFTREILLGPH